MSSPQEDIVGLQRAYADISTRRAWREMTSVAIPDAVFIYHTAAEVIEVRGVEQFAAMGAQTAQHYNFNLILPINCLVTECAGDQAKGRCYFLELAEPIGADSWLEIYGVYQDEYTRIEDGWRMSRREYRPLTRRKGAKGEFFRPYEVIP